MRVVLDTSTLEEQNYSSLLGYQGIVETVLEEGAQHAAPLQGKRMSTELRGVENITD